MQRALESNPIAWLQQYSWKARLGKWGLCLAYVVLACALPTGSTSEMAGYVSLMVLILAAAFTFVGVGSFLTEKKSGALELLLVTPITPNQIIFGRVWGLWKQFLPAGLILLLCWLNAEYLMSFTGAPGWYPSQHRENSGIIWRLLTVPMAEPRLNFNPFNLVQSRFFFVSSTTTNPAFQTIVAAIGFLTLPVFATYFALRVKNLIVAAVLTWLALFLYPFLAFSVLASLSAIFNAQLPPASLYLAVLLSNLAFALLACFLLRHSLSRRIYSF